MSKNPSSESGPAKTSADYKVRYPTEKHHRLAVEFVLALKPSEQDRIWDAILDLARDPRPKGCIKIDPPTPALSAFAHYRITQGNFRILYDIRDETKRVYILAVRRRNEKTY